MFSLPSKTEETVLISSSFWVPHVRSQTEPLTRNPFTRHSSTRSLSSFSLREHVWTLAPSPASSSTMAYLIHGQIDQELNWHCHKNERVQKKKKTQDLYVNGRTDYKLRLTQSLWFHQWPKRSCLSATTYGRWSSCQHFPWSLPLSCLLPSLSYLKAPDDSRNSNLLWPGEEKVVAARQQIKE